MPADTKTPAASAANGAASSAAQTASNEYGEQLQEVVVTARRKAENLQNVPETVDVVSSADVQKYNILTMLDVQKLVPGLTLTDGHGFAQTASMRGIDYNQVQAAPATVAFYLNDIPARANQVFQAFYDLSQVEVLRGPQGTVRGDTAPSGSITLTTTRPDLDSIGGYASASVGEQQTTNVQGAINIPIVQGKFAVRVAVLRDENSVDDVQSVFNPTPPHEESDAARVSARFQPTDDVSAVVIYQHLIRKDINYNGGAFGNGSPGVPGDPLAPAGFNGPQIGIYARQTNAASPALAEYHGDMVQALLDWTFHGQRLSYTGGFNHDTSFNPLCVPANIAPFPCFAQVNSSTEQDWTHELRLNSVEPLFNHLDYTAGYFYNETKVPTTVGLAPTFLGGAFGSPLGPPVPGAPNYNYAVQGTLLTNPNLVRENAVYGSLTYHLDQKTEITGGVRWGAYLHTITTDISFLPTHTALALPGAICGFIGGNFGATYPGVCDFPVNVPTFHTVYGAEPHPILYNVELSHRFNDDLMVYFKTGTGFRASNINLGLAVSTSNPALSPYLFPKDEKSTSYEVGTKADFFDKRLMFDLDYYHQTYSGYFYNTQPAYFLDINGPSTSVSTLSFTTNVPAVVDGVELTANAKVTKNWSISGSFSWANGRLSNASIPCNSSKFNGVVDNIAPTVAQFQAAGQSVALCKSDASTSTAPPWNLTLQSEYNHPVNGNVDGFIRGLVYFYPRNANASLNYVVPAYGLTDVFLGLRGANTKWELSVYGKNILGNQTATSIGATDTWPAGLSAFFGPDTGYFSVTLPPPRQFGVALRYAFGSD